MKYRNIICQGLLAAALTMNVACTNLDLQPLTEPSTMTWNSQLEEVKISLNDMYRKYPYQYLENNYYTDRRTDDWAQRELVYELAGGSLSSSTDWMSNLWYYTYKSINRCNVVINKLQEFKEADARRFEAEAKLFRAYFYSRLIFLWGDVPFYTSDITIEESRQMGRTPKAEILESVYSDFDYAIKNLPVDNEVDGVWRVNKGVALALLARTALYNKDWRKAADAAKACMDLGKYKLAEDYGSLFRSKDYSQGEFIFLIASSEEFGVTENAASFILRIAGGTATAQPSWDLLAAYECTDGKPIDESPLFNRQNPYENRDPRCCETFVAPGTTIYGCVYDPDPDVAQVMVDGALVTNKDNKVKDKWAAFDSTCLRKFAQDSWRTGNKQNDNPTIIVRYADVLLMYAEAKIELGELDDSMLNAINDVRARAYKTKRQNTQNYPALKMGSQDEMRLAVRKERRVEMPWEGRRFFDLLRWDWMRKALSHDYYGHPAPANMKALKKAGKYYWPGVPEIDECGFADFKPFADAGDIVRYGRRLYDERLPLFPIPADEVTISNGKIQNNPGW